MKFTIILLVSAAILGFTFAGCGEKKNDTTEPKKDVTQQKPPQDQTKTSEQKDTVKNKKDTTKTADDGMNIVVMRTSMGTIEIELFPNDAPKHSANFKKLVNDKYYEGTTFHRVIAGFMIQAGDPNSKNDNKADDGQGGPGYTIPAEIKLKHEKGSVAAARLGDQQNPKRESSGSQFYIVTGDASHLDGQYTVFGKVVNGMDVVMKIEKVKTGAGDNPVDKVTIEKVSLKKK